METYVLMTKLSPGVLKDAKSRRAAGQHWKERVEKLCPEVEWVCHYALLGPYDFMDIYRAPDELTAFKVSSISRSEGAVSAESWPALPYEAYLPLLDDIGD